MGNRKDDLEDDFDDDVDDDDDDDRLLIEEQHRSDSRQNNNNNNNSINSNSHPLLLQKETFNATNQAEANILHWKTQNKIFPSKITSVGVKCVCQCCGVDMSCYFFTVSHKDLRPGKSEKKFK